MQVGNIIFETTKLPFNVTTTYINPGKLSDNLITSEQASGDGRKSNKV